MDRSYVDYRRLYELNLGSIFFVTRENPIFKQPNIFSSCRKRAWPKVRPNHSSYRLLFRKDYPKKLRWTKYYDADTNKLFVLVTNNFSLPAMTIAERYQCRWQVKLLFKRIKQHLQIKSFFGTSENVVKNSNLDCGGSLCTNHYHKNTSSCVPTAIRYYRFRVWPFSKLHIQIWHLWVMSPPIRRTTCLTN